MDPHAQGYGQSPAPQYTPYEKSQAGQPFPGNSNPQQMMPQGPYTTLQAEGLQHPVQGQQPQMVPAQQPPPMLQQQSYGNSQPMQMQPGMQQGGQPNMAHPQMMHQNSNFSGQQQPGPGGRTYQNATPLQVLGRGASPVDCPVCGVRAMTRTTYEIGNTTHMWALGAFCFTLCLCFVPYMMNSTKDVAHHCGNCGVLLATYHKSGTTEVHVHA